MRNFSVSEFAEGKKLTLKKTKRNTYEYDYQLTKKEAEFEEKRILLKENEVKRSPCPPFEPFPTRINFIHFTDQIN